MTVSVRNSEFGKSVTIVVSVAILLAGMGSHVLADISAVVVRLPIAVGVVTRVILNGGSCAPPPPKLLNEQVTILPVRETTHFDSGFNVEGETTWIAGSKLIVTVTSTATANCGPLKISNS